MISKKIILIQLDKVDSFLSWMNKFNIKKTLFTYKNGRMTRAYNFKELIVNRCWIIQYIASLYVHDVMCFAYVYHNNMDRLSTALTQSLIRHAIFSQTGTPRRVDCLVPLCEHKRNCLSHGPNDTLPSWGTEPRVANPAVAILCSLSTELHRQYLEY